MTETPPEPVAWPGFETPAVGFDQPFEMLEACHGRVRRSLALLERLVAYVDTAGHDHNSRSAAADVLRYFDVAAPLHHQDEELHVFALLAASPADAMASIVAELLRDHRRMEALWPALRTMLQAWSQPGAAGGANAALRSLVAEFTERYARHMATEEGLVFPAAQQRAQPSQLGAMSSDMRRRRGAAVTDEPPNP